jgi:hypothetical protein
MIRSDPSTGIMISIHFDHVACHSERTYAFPFQGGGAKLVGRQLGYLSVYKLVKLTFQEQLLKIIGPFFVVPTFLDLTRSI